jgi:hypothetical protein
MSHGYAASAGVVLSIACSVALAAPVTERAPAFSVYAAQMSGERTWQNVLTEPGGKFVDEYLLAGALSMSYAQFMHDSLRLEAEGQLVYNFGVQDHWELNAVPVVARWRRFPWSERIATTAAFGLGVSYATELPVMERTLEGGSEQFLVHWFAELTAGPASAPWALSLRLHHRSDGFGLMGERGGMNALGLGVRVAF